MIAIKSVKTERTKLRRSITVMKKWLEKPPTSAKNTEVAMMRQQLTQVEALERTLTLRIEAADGDS